jgi:iron-siderophore transport system permease protein
MTDLPLPLEASLADARVLVRHARVVGQRRSTVVAIVLAAAAVVLLCFSLALGDYHVALHDVPGAIFGHGTAGDVFVVQHLRLPRAVGALLVGGAFGFSGAIFQSLARNPLASPDILGITAGASVAAVFIITVVGGTHTTLSIAAFAGATIVALTIYGLAYRAGVSAYRLVLVGIGVGAVCQAITSYLLARSNLFLVGQAIVWLTGSLNSIGWTAIVPLLIAVAVLTLGVLALSAPLRILQLGDDTARGLGVKMETVRLSLILVAVGLVAAGTAAVGPIAFVAFVAPPIARRLTRASGVTLVPAALTGALLVLSADFIAQHAFGTELPVGVITGTIGGTYLLWLISRANRIGRGG